MSILAETIPRGEIAQVLCHNSEGAGELQEEGQASAKKCVASRQTPPDYQCWRLLNFEHHLAERHGLPRLDGDLMDGALDGRANFILHFHRFEHEQRLADLD